MRHKHADVITAWASGQEIEYKDPEMRMWFNWRSTSWNDELEYRIKPKEPNWWENIPEHGILVKDKGESGGDVLRFIKSEVYENIEDDYEPLTNEEIEAFKR